MLKKKERAAEEQKPTKLTIQLPTFVVKDLEIMSQNTKKTVDELVEISLKMYIATHNDYLQRNKVP